MTTRTKQEIKKKRQKKGALEDCWKEQEEKDREKPEGEKIRLRGKVLKWTAFQGKTATQKPSIIRPKTHAKLLQATEQERPL